jgi:hypothetical protein
MVKGYEVSEDGTLREVELSKAGLDSGKVVCVVDDETKSIYLWKGSRADIRRKFVGARIATNLRTEYGFNFKVRPVEEGEEPPSFFTALDGSTAAVPVMKPGEAPPPQKPPAPKAKAESRRAEPEPARAPPAPAAPPALRTGVSAGTSRSSTPAVVSEDEIQGMLEELEKQPPPEGYNRELLIVHNELYTIAQHKLVVFGKETLEKRFERVKDPPEGTFMAEGFVPRVIVKDHKVLGIELLKGTPDAILSPIKAEMKERLSDLISFFKSELDGAPEEASETGDEGKSPAKKKLVAK